MVEKFKQPTSVNDLEALLKRQLNMIQEKEYESHSFRSDIVNETLHLKAE